MISVLYTSTVFGAGYTCPTYKEYVSCNPGYVLNSTGPGNACVPAPTCDAGYYLTDAGQCEICPGGYYCESGQKIECPNGLTHQRTTFPAEYYNPKIFSANIVLTSGRQAISGCEVLAWLNTDRGMMYEYVKYNPDTEQYDITRSHNWASSTPGYYLAYKMNSTCGASTAAYWYYKEALVCPAGYYCPGQERIKCSADNKDTPLSEMLGMEPCPAGTYSGPGQSACTPCPDGYSNSEDAAGGHVDITSCVAECAAGYYVPSPGEPCTEITGSVPYYTAAHTVTYGDTSGDNYKKCPDVAPGDTWYTWIDIPDVKGHTTVNSCLRHNVRLRHTYDPKQPSCRNGICIAQQTTHGIVNNPCYYTSGDNGNAVYDNNVLTSDQTGCVGGSSLISCDAGFYAPVKIWNGAGPYQSCQPVGNGYWSPDGDLARYPCPDGTMTIGYGVGAANVNDCVPYKNLHIGDMTLQMSSTKYTTPALHIQLPDGNKYYGYMISGARDGTLNIGLPGGQYGVINPLDQFMHTMHPGDGYSVPPFEIIEIP